MQCRFMGKNNASEPCRVQRAVGRIAARNRAKMQFPWPQRFDHRRHHYVTEEDAVSCVKYICVRMGAHNAGELFIHRQSH